MFLILPSGTLDFKKLIASTWAFTKDCGSWRNENIYDLGSYVYQVPFLSDYLSHLTSSLGKFHKRGIIKSFGQREKTWGPDR